MLDETSRAALGAPGAGAQSGRQVDAPGPGLRRRRAQQGARRILRPRRLHDRCEDRDRHLGAGRAAAEGAPLVAGIVIAYPHRNRDLVRKADEPSVILVLRSAGLAAHIGREMPDRTLATAFDDSL